MSDKTKIEWTDASWTPIRASYIEIQNDGSGKERIGWHCEHPSEGCRHCHAEAMNNRLGPGLAFKPGNIFREEKRGYHNGEAKLFLDEKLLLQPLKWKRPRMIFVCSMTDLFADFVPDEWIDRVFAVMALCPQHTFQVLTKRSARMRAYFQSSGESFEFPDGSGTMHLPRNGGLLNVWLGVSAEDQKRADERIPDLLATPAAERFVSAEPLLGPIDFTRVTGHSGTVFDALVPWRPCRIGGTTIEHGASTPILDWVIVGGESGKGARPMHPDWARSIRDQCGAAGVAFFFKQWGEWAPQIGAVDGWTINDDPEQSRFDHREWDEDDQCWSDVFRPIWCDFEDGNYDEAQTVSRLGKKRSGRLLDGREWNEMPDVTGKAVAA